MSIRDREKNNTVFGRKKQHSVWEKEKTEGVGEKNSTVSVRKKEEKDNFPLSMKGYNLTSKYFDSRLKVIAAATPSRSATYAM